jgi:hypothetical protein
MSDHIPVCMQVIVGGNVGLMEQNELIKSAYVNDNNELKIELDKHVNNLEIKILDMSGKLVLNNNYFYNSEFELQLDGVSSGIYLATLLADGEFSTFKFLIIE